MAPNTSLPLMGVRNSGIDRFSTWSSLPQSSLPLMGIRNSGRRSGIASSRVTNLLTTPHGDQKLDAESLLRSESDQ